MSTISAGTTSTTALVSTGDTTGNLVLATGSVPTTALTLNSTTQAATFAGAVNFASWTTATRPASPAVGQMGYNTTTGKFDQYTAASWTSVSTQTTGQVLQLVSATGTALVSILGGPTTTGFSASITPTASTSKVLVLFNGRFYTTSGAEIKASIYRGASAIQGNYLCYNSSGSIAAAQQILVLDSPATTSSTTYTLYLTGINNNAVLNPNGASDGPYSFTLMEIAA